MSTWMKSCLAALLTTMSTSFCGCARTVPPPGITAVWAIDESEKVKREDLAHWGKSDTGNAVWNGKEIHIFGVRNEIVGFQVILEAAGKGASKVDVQFDSLSHPLYVIKNDRRSGDPFRYVGKRIELFTETYVEKTQRGDWWLWSSRPLPDEQHLGWIPDALVPFGVNGPFEHGSSGPPFDIPPASNQGVWVDVYIPKEAAAGLYRGMVTVRERDTVRFVLPVRLEVFDAVLPDVTHLHNHFFWSWPVITARHGPEKDSLPYWKIFRAYCQFFHRHRLDLIDGTRTLKEFKKYLAGYYSGEYYRPAYGYDGPGVGVGNKTYSIGTYDQPSDGWRSGFFPDTPSAWQAAADSWEQWFRDHAPDVMRFKYMEDEPPYAHWPDLRRRAGWIKSSPGPGKYLDILATTRMGAELVGFVTIWMPGGHCGWPDSGGTTGYDLPVARERQRAGDKVGFYNGQRPAQGEAESLDNFATDARVNPWICWKYGADQYFLWETTYYAGFNVNIWSRSYPGSVVYAGEDRKYPKDSRGLKGPIATIRLKNLRRGFQDYEYLWLAREKGLNTGQIVGSVVPAALNDYSQPGFTSQSGQPIWSNKGFVFERARRLLAQLISSARDTLK